MAETKLFEAERSAWIKGRRWPDRHAATRRAEMLSRTARKADRSDTGLGETPLHEAGLKSSFRLWSERGEDVGTSALGAVAYVLYTNFRVVWFGVTWSLSWVLYKAWETNAAKKPVMVAPYVAAAGAVGLLFLAGRPAGADLWLIHWFADALETGTGGLIAPRILSGWYAAALVSWLEIQITLAFVVAGWRAYSWGWAAPAVRKATNARRTGADKGVRIISDLNASPARKGEEEGDPGMKIISGNTTGGN